MNINEIKAKIKKCEVLHKVGIATLIASLGLSVATGIWVGHQVEKMNDSSFDVELVNREEMSGYTKYVVEVARGYYNQYKEGKITAEQYNSLMDKLNSKEMLYDYARSLNDENINKMLDDKEEEKQDFLNRNYAIGLTFLGLGTAGYVTSAYAQRKKDKYELQSAMLEVEEEMAD